MLKANVRFHFHGQLSDNDERGCGYKIIDEKCIYYIRKLIYNRFFT